ncbi:MAG: NAD(P)/FAD-dependent oxidoreductase [Propionibacteriaceae bacterium]
MGLTIVVGGGISGAACARVLVDAGREVVLLDRGRKLGGRMGVRTFAGRPVDVGASYFTAEDPTFTAVVRDWERRGLARPWTDTFAVRSDAGEDVKTGPMRWAAPGGLRTLVVDLTHGIEVESHHPVAAVTRSDGRLAVDGRRADTVVLAMPDPQARRLLPPELAGYDALDARYDPVLVLTSIWPERSWSPRDAIFVNGDDTVAFVIDDGLRRGDRAPVLVVHSTTEFAAARLADPDSGINPMLARLRRIIGLDASTVPTLVSMHRWSFAKPQGAREQPYLLTADGLGVCGDGWSTKPRVEAAFGSGYRLARALLSGD